MGVALRKEKHYTYADYLTWPDDARYELIDGEAFLMAPAPLIEHQEVAGDVYHQLRNQLDGKPCRPYIAPVDVRLPRADEADAAIDTVVQPDVLVVCDPAKIDRLARMPKLGATVTVCVDDVANVADLSAAAVKHGTNLGVFVEIDCGAGRCGVKTTAAVVEIAQAIDAAPNLKFTGIQAYQGAMQHMDSFEDRKAKLDAAIAQASKR